MVGFHSIFRSDGLSCVSGRAVSTWRARAEQGHFRSLRGVYQLTQWQLSVNQTLSLAAGWKHVASGHLRQHARKDGGSLGSRVTTPAPPSFFC